MLQYPDISLHLPYYHVAMPLYIAAFTLLSCYYAPVYRCIYLIMFSYLDISLQLPYYHVPIPRYIAAFIPYYHVNIPLHIAALTFIIMLAFSDISLHLPYYHVGIPRYIAAFTLLSCYSIPRYIAAFTFLSCWHSPIYRCIYISFLHAPCTALHCRLHYEGTLLITRLLITAYQSRVPRTQRTIIGKDREPAPTARSVPNMAHACIQHCGSIGSIVFHL